MLLVFTKILQKMDVILHRVKSNYECNLGGKQSQKSYLEPTGVCEKDQYIDIRKGGI